MLSNVPTTNQSSFHTGEDATRPGSSSSSSGGSNGLAASGVLPAHRAYLHVRPLSTGDEKLALDLLNEQPVANVTIIGLIREHGLVSPRNRGVFYGCFAAEQLIGLALIGHCVQLYGRAESAGSFAAVARAAHATAIRMVLGEMTLTDEFCRRLFAPPFQLQAHKVMPQQLLTLAEVSPALTSVAGLRLARDGEALELARLNAAAYVELNGVDPLAQDADGFHERLRARIRKEHIWLVRDAEGIAFKADIVSETDDAVYLEGVMTRADLRGAGLGTRALGDLCRRLLRRRKAVCLFADAGKTPTLNFYRRLGFSPVAAYQVVHCRRADAARN